jgi:hypothetical protein
LYKKAKVYYEPLGVVAAIVSWNYRKSALMLCQSKRHADIWDSSPSQCVVAHPGIHFCWERRRLEMFREGHLVIDLVRGGDPKMS